MRLFLKVMALSLQQLVQALNLKPGSVMISLRLLMVLLQASKLKEPLLPLKRRWVRGLLRIQGLLISVSSNLRRPVLIA